MSLLEEYALTKTFTPLLNTEDFLSVFGGKEGSSLPFDEKGLVRAFESVLFPKTKIKILKRRNSIVQVETKEYPYAGSFFIDERFLEKTDKKSSERIVSLPSSQKILETLNTLLQFPYIWGGNCLKIPELLSFYPPQKPLSKETLACWTLSGFDCSGLIYYASNGFVPRNTSSWFHFGQGIRIEGKKLSEIILSLKPLDAVVWKGHIFFIQDSLHAIESIIKKGVVITNLQDRFEELLQGGFIPKDSREGKETEFLIRRWHPCS